MEILQLNLMWACASVCKSLAKGQKKPRVSQEGGEEEEGSRPSEEEASKLKSEIENVITLRDQVVSLLSEYAIDPESIAPQNIKRAVRVFYVSVFLILRK